MKVVHVVGARPNFMKVAPILHEMAKHPDWFEQILVHTGQHYDEIMSKVFFSDLEMPQPDFNLEVGSGSHAQQTAMVMQRFEPLLIDFNPDWVLVPGDVNSTVACALVASKLGIKIGHVEAGLRSFDRTMPEEINRIVTDHISDMLFTTEQSGNDNLKREGVSQEKIRFVGNTMIDTLVRLRPKAKARWPKLKELFELDRFMLVTLHRPSNVDDLTGLSKMMEDLSEISNHIPTIFPVHPRTRQRLAALNALPPSCILTEPFGYLDFLALEAHASLVLTDSGGVQEETSYLGVPCLTLRANTERPITLTRGTNQLVKGEGQTLVEQVTKILSTEQLKKTQLELWDGQAAQRIIKSLMEV